MPPPGGGGSGEPRSARLDAERPGGEEHLEFLVSHFSEPAVARWHWPPNLPGGGPRTPEQTIEILDAGAAHWEEHGFGWWLWRERSSGELVGRVGNALTAIEGAEAVELGWSVALGAQGRGYATEAAVASLEHGFGVAGLKELVSFTWTENAASRRVMEKAGLSFERCFVHAGLPHVLHVARAGEWSPPTGGLPVEWTIDPA